MCLAEDDEVIEHFVFRSLNPRLRVGSYWDFAADRAELQPMDSRIEQNCSVNLASRSRMVWVGR